VRNSTVIADRAITRLAGKVILVTGGSMGIGEAIARGCAAQGAKVALSARGREAGEAVAADIRAQGGEAQFYAHDVASPDDWRIVIEAVTTRWGVLHGVVNNAGRGVRRFLPEMTKDEFIDLNRLNLYSAFLGMKLGIAAMGEAGGAIVNIGSSSCFEAVTGGSAYAASKAAILGLARARRGIARPGHVRVHTIMPGRFMTVIMANGAPPEQRRAEAEANPMKRFGDPLELVEPLTFLLSDGARHLDGVELVVNGGATL
jgi:NAD(P)-dependent dehydrogenase (short-subunit alcohol dehydrogenase family)